MFGLTTVAPAATHQALGIRPAGAIYMPAGQIDYSQPPTAGLAVGVVAAGAVYGVIGGAIVGGLVGLIAGCRR